MRVNINCEHKDNWDRCRIKKAHWLVRWLLPKGRPLCVLVLPSYPQDPGEEVRCAEQKERPRPKRTTQPAPAPQGGVPPR